MLTGQFEEREARRGIPRRQTRRQRGLPNSRHMLTGQLEEREARRGIPRLQTRCRRGLPNSRHMLTGQLEERETRRGILSNLRRTVGQDKPRRHDNLSFPFLISDLRVSILFSHISHDYLLLINF